MRRKRILTIVLGLAICAGALPLLAAFYVSRERAFALERQHLADYADWTLKRGDLNISRARAALDQLGPDEPQTCSPADIARLQQLTTDTLSVEEIAITRGGRLICNTWGPVRSEMWLAGQLLPNGRRRHRCFRRPDEG